MKRTEKSDIITVVSCICGLVFLLTGFGYLSCEFDETFLLLYASANVPIYRLIATLRDNQLSFITRGVYQGASGASMDAPGVGL